jgi:hypothetical protein
MVTIESLAELSAEEASNRRGDKVGHNLLDILFILSLVFASRWPGRP